MSGAAGARPRHRSPITIPPGLLLGVVGVVGFSFTLPMAKIAVEGGLEPMFVGSGRGVIGAVLAAAFLAITRAPRPNKDMVMSLMVCGAGVVVGFPILTSLAVEVDSATHAVIVTGIIPAATAMFAVLRAGERPSLAFWLAAGLGLLAVLVFAGVENGAGFGRGDVLLLGAVVLCGMGYAEGAVLARTIGGPATISWALVVCFPLTVAITAGVFVLRGWPEANLGGWLSFSYAGVISVFLALFAWYAGLARGGVAKIGQIQLVQPLLSLAWAALLVGEVVGWAEAMAALAIVGCVAGTQRARVSSAEQADRTR